MTTAKLFIISIYSLPFLIVLYLIFIYMIVRVPYVRTNRKYFSIIAKNLSINEKSTIYDLGCGFGELLFYIEKEYKSAKLVGIEISPLHIIYAKIKAKFVNSRIEFKQNDFYKEKIGDADVIYLFLNQPAIDNVWTKIKRETKAGTMVVILGNSITGETELKKIPIRQSGHKNTYYHLYEVS